METKLEWHYAKEEMPALHHGILFFTDHWLAHSGWLDLDGFYCASDECQSVIKDVVIWAYMPKNPISPGQCISTDEACMALFNIDRTVVKMKRE